MTAQEDICSSTEDEQNVKRWKGTFLGSKVLSFFCREASIRGSEIALSERERSSLAYATTATSFRIIIEAAGKSSPLVVPILRKMRRVANLAAFLDLLVAMLPSDSVDNVGIGKRRRTTSRDKRGFARSVVGAAGR